METAVKGRARPSAIRVFPCVSVDDESVISAGSRPRVKWDTGRAIRQVDLAEPAGWSAMTPER